MSKERQEKVAWRVGIKNTDKDDEAMDVSSLEWGMHPLELRSEGDSAKIGDPRDYAEDVTTMLCMKAESEYSADDASLSTMPRRL